LVELGDRLDARMHDAGRLPLEIAELLRDLDPRRLAALVAEGLREVDGQRAGVRHRRRHRLLLRLLRDARAQQVAAELGRRRHQLADAVEIFLDALGEAPLLRDLEQRLGVADRCLRGDHAQATSPAPTSATTSEAIRRCSRSSSDLRTTTLAALSARSTAPRPI